MDALVPNRECGDCAVCCLVPPVSSPEFRKQSGVWCDHCPEGKGCAIYETRPPVCRDWFCGWRQLPLLTDAWRPDRSGILIVFDDQDEAQIPPRYPIRSAVKFVITGSRDVLRAKYFLDYLAGLVFHEVPTFLAVPGPPGCFFAKAFLNDALGEDVRRSDGAAMGAKLLKLHELLARGLFEAVDLGHGQAPFD